MSVPTIRPLVGIETPWAGLDAGGPKSMEYLRAALRDSLSHGELPWASHCTLAMTRALYEEDPDQRAEGLDVNCAFIQHYATAVIFYIDHGMSNGMKQARQWCGLYRKPFFFRKIYSHG
jgi:hypothetical protein